MKPNVAILAGGNSGEYEVSINSAAVIFRFIDRNKYNPYIIHIRGAEWTYKDNDGKTVEVDKNDFSIHKGNRKINFHCILIAIHGTPGEDGKLQGYFDLLGIPYTTSDLTTSALTFNKDFSKRVVSTLGIKTPSSVLLARDQEFSLAEIVDCLSLPCFVKPNNGGSSVGTTKVVKEDELHRAIEVAFKEDDQVIIEEYIDGTELTCGIVQTGNQIITFPITEIVSRKDFFDYEAKYTEGMADEIVPARISDIISDECKRISGFLYHKLNCKGLVRFDYIYKDDQFYFLEVNTVPGLSEGSIVPKMARAMDISLTRLYDIMLENVLKRV